MAINTSGFIKDFHQETTKRFDVIFTDSRDISGDTMKLYLTTPESGIVLSSSADMTTSGSIGQALFTLDSSTTNIKARHYNAEIVYETSVGEKYLILKQDINIKERYSN